MKIITFNFNGWMPVSKFSYKQKIWIFAQYIRSKYNGIDIIALQEFISSGGKYITELREALGNEYIVLTPPDFDYKDHPKSILTITLLRANKIRGFKVENFDCVLPNRISYVTVFFEEAEVRILNIYNVQIQNFKGHKPNDAYVTNRIAQHNRMWKEILAEVELRKNDPMIILGDFQESSEAKHIIKLNGLGFKEMVKNYPTVKTDFFKESCIDHIMYSEAAWDSFKPSSFALDGSLLDEVSDHSILVAM